MCHFSGDSECLGLRESRMHIDKNFERRKPVAQGANDVARYLQIGILHKALGCAEGIDLERVKTLLDHGFRCANKVFRGALCPIPAIGIAQHRVSHSSAQQLPDRHAKRFAQNIPAGHFDGGNRRAMDMAPIQ